MDTFELKGKYRMFTLILSVIGIVLMGIGFGTSHGQVDGDRIWADLLVNGLLFFFVALAAVFFISVQYAAESGWPIVLKRVYEAVAAWLPIGSVILIVIFAAGFAHQHHLYHWMDQAAVDADPLLKHKTPFLNVGMFMGLTIVFLLGYNWYNMVQRKRSIADDANAGSDSTVIHFKNVKSSAIFLVFFGFTSMVASWLWLMSIDTHWFSTIFGWYMFAGMWISGLTVMTAFGLWLKSLGYLPDVNDNHFHNMGKWMFAVSFLWAYLFFAQFLLIWYSNIPEEVTYYMARWEDYRGIFWVMFFVNFAVPMLSLMDTDAKRTKWVLWTMCIILFIFHWVDMMVMIFPGTLKQDGFPNFGSLVFDFGMMLTFLGAFLLTTLMALTKAPLQVKHHPYLEESIHHHVVRD